MVAVGGDGGGGGADFLLGIEVTLAMAPVPVTIGNGGAGPFVQRFRDVVREAELVVCCLPGVLVWHSLGCCAGSGMGTLPAPRVREGYPDRSGRGSL